MKLYFEKSLSEINEEFSKKLSVEKKKVKDDFVVQQSENFRLQKEVMVLSRDTQKLENERDKAIKRIIELESRLMGLPIFDLENNDPDLENLSTEILRVEKQHLIKNKKVLH